MSTAGTTKTAGASCPKCHDPYPAEYAMKGERPRWRCSCGAEGELLGHVSGATPPAPRRPDAGPLPCPTWGRNLTRSRP